jgi:hypothetical protein
MIVMCHTKKTKADHQEIGFAQKKQAGELA